MVANEEERKRALKVAIETEEDGLDMYNAAAEKAENPIAKKMFEGLAEDEKHHLEMIKAIAEYMGLEGMWQAAREGTPTDRLETIFTKAREEVVEKEAPTADEFQALGRAMKFEKNGHDYYVEAAEKATDEDAKELFERLAQEEDEHYRILESTREYLDRTGEWFLSDEWGLLSGDMYAGE